MFSWLKALHKQIPRQHLKTMYALGLMISLFGIVLLGQLLTQLFSIQMISKVSGRVVNKKIQTSYISEGRNRNVPVYSLALTLTDGHTYNVELNEENQDIGQLIYKGGKVNLYFPPAFYNVLSLDIINHGSRAVQVEFEGEVLDSFASYQRARIPFILYTTAAIIFFIIMFFIWRKQVLPNNIEEVSTSE